MQDIIEIEKNQNFIIHVLCWLQKAHKCTQGGEVGRGYNIGPARQFFKKLVNKNAIVAQIGPPAPLAKH